MDRAGRPDIAAAAGSTADSLSRYGHVGGQYSAGDTLLVIDYELVVADNFEMGDLSRWSASAP